MVSIATVFRGVSLASVLVVLSLHATNAQEATLHESTPHESTLRILNSQEDVMWSEISADQHPSAIGEPLKTMEHPPLAVIDDDANDHDAVDHDATDHDASAPPHEFTDGPSEETAECKCGHQKYRGVCRDPGHPKKPKRTLPGDVDRGDCPPARYRMSDFSRAGKPTCVHRFAKCSVDDSYSAWFVGGGAAFFRGRPRRSSEGTWGLDYDGLLGKANHWLNYTRCREQGGEGAYATDGEPEFVSRVHGFLGLGH